MTAHSSYDTRVTGTTEEKQLAAKMAKTYAGQADFASGNMECRQCSRFGFKGYDGQRNIKQGRCSKYRQLLGQDGPKFPGTAKACKYFEAGIDHPAHTGMEGDYRQRHGADHIWGDFKRKAREHVEKGGHLGGGFEGMEANIRRGLENARRNAEQRTEAEGETPIDKQT